MPSASDDVQTAIAAAGGAIRFDEFMRIALYGDHGFYATGGQAGRRGCRSRGLSEDRWEVGKGPLRGGAPQPLVALAGQPLHPVENMCVSVEKGGVG